MKLRLLAAIILISLGGMLAEDVGHCANYLSRPVVANPMARSVTHFLFQHAPTAIYRFEQELLVKYSLAVYFFAIGAVAAYFLGIWRARYGVIFPLTFACWFSAKLLYLAPQYFEQLQWYDMLDHVAAMFSMVAIYWMGCNLGAWINRRTQFRWNRWDCMIAITWSSLLFFGISGMRFYLVDAAILVGMSWLAWRTSPDGQTPRGQSPETICL